MTCEEVRPRLGPYVDSQLSAGELQSFETHLRECKDCSSSALAMLQMKLKTRAAAAARYTPSAEFRRKMEETIRAKQKRRWWALRVPQMATAGALATVMLVGSTALWMNHRERDRELSELADLHVATLASANPVDVVSTDRHTVKPWFAGKVPFTFNVPELQNTDFKLEGGRVTYFQNTPGAQLLFSLRKHQLSVFIFRDSAAIAQLGSSTSTRLAFHTESWSEGGLHYLVISDASAADVHALSVLMKNAARS